MKTDLSCAIVQQCLDVDRAHNLEQTRAALARCADAGAQLALLPELHAGRYFCQTEEQAGFDLAEPVPGPTSEALGAMAREFRLVIIGSVFERRTAGVYHNTAVVLDSDGRLAGRYRKTHIPDDPGYHEKYYFTPGDSLEPIDTSVGRLGVLVCWDQWFPEAARAMALKGAELLAYPSAIGWEPVDSGEEKNRQLDSWRTVQRGHAVANGLPLLCSNRCGYEAANGGPGAGIDFWGHSFICGPQGEILAEAGAEPGEILAVLTAGRSEAVRRGWPFLRDRRIDTYGGLLRRVDDE
ncbi:MAG: carbon-nitrogen hydrolase [Gammaproteobacteria bacterium]|jgi:N-carbamoylputrescine amidase|nr:carbon-nitrogen hydrolase [Gammaproteobacteria bacterium]